MNRGRQEERRTRIFRAMLPRSMRRKWQSVKTFIVVERNVLKKGVVHDETAYFISDLPPQTGAEYFARGIRSHWQVESFHYVKDVTFKEDASKVRSKNAPGNYSLLRNIAINIFRRHGWVSIQAALEKCANNIPYMMTLI